MNGSAVGPATVLRRRAKRRLLGQLIRARMVASGSRPVPSFLIIGAQRGGTSSLFTYLRGHPGLAASLRKETEYFSRRYGEGEIWYRAHFPRRRNEQTLAFEATPDYLFFPPTPGRVASDLPDARFVVLLRDPVERAYSHYRHMRRLGFEHLSFSEAVASEGERIRRDARSLEHDPLHHCRELLRFSYAARGLYAEQLERWFAHFDRDRFLIVRSEDLFADPASVFQTVLGFIGARPWRPRAFANHSYPAAMPKKSPIPLESVGALREIIEPDVHRLEAMLGRSMAWSIGEPGEGTDAWHER